MLVLGRVQNGVVVLEAGVQLPEGQEVSVLAHQPHCANSHGVLDIPAISLGQVLTPLTPDEDLLAEMLEGRP